MGNLVLTRKVGEKIMIGEDKWVEVVEVRGKTVRLGVHAPGDVRIQRAEIERDTRHKPEGGTVRR